MTIQAGCVLAVRREGNWQVFILRKSPSESTGGRSTLEDPRGEADWSIYARKEEV